MDAIEAPELDACLAQLHRHSIDVSADSRAIGARELNLGREMRIECRFRHRKSFLFGLPADASMKSERQLALADWCLRSER